MDATETLQKIQSGITTIEKVVSDSTAKIQATHQKLNVATEILADDTASQMQNLHEGPLKGLPVSIKECYAISGKKITSGSKRMKPIICKEDAAVVKKLKNAGAVLVARGNTSEFLLGRETDNLIFGTTNNPINPTLTIGGSSGGDAAMVASECVAFGVGTDIGGSCRYPAVFSGIIGFKPASGQIDKTGIFPTAGNEFTETMNSPGILCRSVRDARLVYNVIGNKQLTKNNDISKVQLYTSTNFKVKIEDTSISDTLKASVEYFSKSGMIIKDLDINESASLYTNFNTLMFAGFTDNIYKWSETEDRKKLSFIGELFRRWRGKPTISNELFALLFPFNLYKPSESKLKSTIETVVSLREKYNSILGKNGILLLPTVGILAPMHKKFIPQYNKPGIIEIITPISFCNVLNLSCISLPAWKYQKNKNINPPGLQLISASGNEELLLNVAENIESQLQK
jgi:Asp-tRNA(Asn)/Glu-tRNA(Gln) amidotransferase A subunit family amidase